MFCCAISTEKQISKNEALERTQKLKKEIQKGLHTIRKDPDSNYWSEIKFVSDITEDKRKQIISKLKCAVKKALGKIGKREIKESAITRMETILAEKFEREMRSNIEARGLPQVTQRLLFNEIRRALKDDIDRQFLIREKFKKSS